MVRKDITISLDEEQIDELLEIAETRMITFSSLIREIITSFLRQSDTDKQLELPVYSTDTETKESDTGGLAEQVAGHDASIIRLETRVSVLEKFLNVRIPENGFTPDNSFGIRVPDIQAAPSLSSVIDCDLSNGGQISDEALVKVQSSPVLPVMDAMEMGSMRIRPDKDYSQTEAAVALNVSVSTMRKYIKEKRIDARKVGRSWLVHGRDILNYLSQT